jgi:hypothetical protein
MESILGLVLEFSVLYSGILVIIYNFTLSRLEQYFMFDSDYKVVRGTVFILVVSLFSTFLKIPAEVYRILFIDAAYQSLFFANSQLRYPYCITDCVDRVDTGY